MATFNPRIFTAPGRLKTIAPARLIAFFGPWREYFAGRGVTLPNDPEEEFPYQEICDVLMSPDENVPRDMVDALYFVHETASEENMDALLALAQNGGVQIEHDPESSVADVAVQVWLADHELLQERHYEAAAFHQTKFMYFGGTDGRSRPFPTLTEPKRDLIEAMLDDWYDAHRRGRGCKIFVYPRGSRVWILVRHGTTMRREGSIRDGQSSTEFYRPEQHDVLMYDTDLDQMGVNAKTKGEMEICLRVFGEVLFGSADYFPPVPKFRLDPLVAFGPEALVCDDIEGLTNVRLVEYQKFWGGMHKEIEVRKATDVFAAAGDQWPRRLTGRLTSVTFKIKFDGSDKERSVNIRPPNIAKYERDADSELVEDWLRARGFCGEPPGGDDDAPADEVLEDA